MKFTINNILSLLSPYRGKPYIQPGNKKTYRWVSLLPEEPEILNPELLYVCRLSEAQRHNHDKADCHFVCICDRYLADEEREDLELMHNIIVIEENKSVSWLLNLIQARFLELEEWEKRLKDVLLDEGGYQDILDVSECYLKNSLFVLDGSYRLVAYSKRYKSSDPINISLYEKGYHSAEVMERFYNFNRFEEYYENPGIVIGKPGTVAQFEAMTKWCRYDGVPQIHVVEVFSHFPIAVESAELFEVMMKYINICFLKEQKKHTADSQPYSRFMRDMIYGDLTDPDQIAEFVKRTSIPLKGNFNAYRIVFKNNGKVLMGRFVQELSQYLTCSKIVTKDFEVSVVNVYPKHDIGELSRRNVQKIRPLLEKHGAMLGISAPFSSMMDLRHACLQAAYALQYGERIGDTESAGDRVYEYGSMLLYHMIQISESGQFNIFYNNPYVQKINELKAYDLEHDCDLTGLLCCFLHDERRATETGKKLHLHRNTVMYHVQHIQEMLAIDLDDYMTRQGLLFAYYYIKLKDTE